MLRQNYKSYSKKMEIHCQREVIKETGKPHQKTFTIKCIDQATNNYVTASSSSIKKAEQKAAEMLLKRLDGNGD